MAYLRPDPPAFMFFVHPRDMADLYNAPGAAMISQYSRTQEEFRDRMVSLPPTVGGIATFGFGPIYGEVLCVMRLPEQIMFTSGREQIEEGVRVAIARGTKVIGLGALTAPATRGGQTLLPMIPRGMTLTTGNAYTAAVARSNVDQAAAAMGLGTDAKIAVVGCTGSVGVCASRLLDRRGYRLTLIGRSVTRVRKELPDLLDRAAVSGSIAEIAHADITVLLTSDPAAQVTPDLPTAGAAVLDLAHPFNVPIESYPAFDARGVHVAAGGLVDIPNFRCTQEMRLPDPHCALACLTETYLFARAGITDHSVGQAAVETALMLEELAADFGVKPHPLDMPAMATTASGPAR